MQKPDTQRHGALPPELGTSFSVADARKAGIKSGRLRGADLSRPFHGVRAITPTPGQNTRTAESRGAGLRTSGDVEGGSGIGSSIGSAIFTAAGASTAAKREEKRKLNALHLAKMYALRMRESEFFSHETAALIWGAPMPTLVDEQPHVSVFRSDSAPRSRNIHGHRVSPGLATAVTHDDLQVASAATTWAMLGHLQLFDLVAIGDFFVRVWREDGYFRPNAGTAPLATLEQLATATLTGKRSGIRNLRLALPLIRTDAWSRTETWTRLTLTAAGLPEPVLNQDQYDGWGTHLGCIDLAYPQFKIAIEYQGMHHAGRYAQDIDRVEALRSAGWIVIQVAAPLLFTRSAELVRRVRGALVKRGWRD
ncbi:MAG: hypothetical protein EPN48_16115 [Microbacteriaceae bacterium]|nr:MAG: hypothetical protein EPN48_16115 [Microbacteriaceae bacterium]